MAPSNGGWSGGFSKTTTGTSGDDSLTGSQNADSISGLAGNDTISGGSGNDTISGGAGDDSISGGDGADYILGGDGDDTIEGGSGNDTVYAGDGNDVWLAGDSLSGSDTVYLEAGDDLAYAGWFYSGTPDLIDFGEGNDTLSLEELPDENDQGITLNDDGTSTTINFGTTILNVENVIGNGGDNALTGNSSANMLSGLAGDDTLTGNAGDDSLYGGDGDDVLSGGDDDDLLTGDAGADSLSGGSGDDSLDGGDDDDTLSGGEGDDTLHGGAGADVLEGGAGMDYADYSDSDSAVSVDLSSGSGSGGDADGDTYSGVDGIYGSEYNDTLIGFDAASTDSSDSYTNVIYGNGGDDYIDGAGGGDSLYGGDGNDTVIGGDGDDLVSGGDGDDSLTGDDGDDSLTGEAGDDTILGGDGDDTLLGGDGDDYLDGGTGDNVYEGGTGSDTIVVHAGSSAEIVGGEDEDDSDVDVLLVDRSEGTIVSDGEGTESGYIQWNDGTTTRYENIESAQYVPCFTPGTLIETKRGPVAVESLHPGDKVLTRDNGYQRIRWVGRRDLGAAELAAFPQLQPVRIAQGALGEGLPETDMLVSPQHRMLISGTRAELLFGEAEVLAAALHMVGLPGVTRVAVNQVSYLHLMCEAHEIIRAAGAWTESFQPGDRSLSGLDCAQRAELLTLFPELEGRRRRGAYTAARRSLRAHEVRVLMAG